MTILEVETKYCDKCEHQSYCHTPCALVLAALYDLPCEKEILQICKEKENKNG